MCGSSTRDKPSSRGFSAAAVTTLQLRRAAHKMAHAVSGGGGGSGSSGATGADIDMLEKQELTVGGAGGEGSAAPEGYITTLDKDGNIKEVNRCKAF